MGSEYSDWAEFTGPIYMGANSTWEMIWLIIAVVLCILALIFGSKHELDAYKKMKK